MNRQRAGSAGIDSKVFRETIARMRQEVLESKAETQRVQDQLNCLIHLVKRAWLGDAAASIHVANIVGVAPPNMTTQEVENDMVAVHAEPKHPRGKYSSSVSFITEGPISVTTHVTKPRVINNWAMLAIGLLNRYYKEKEIEAEEQAKKHLTRRIDYLEELLLHHRNMMNDLPRRSVKTVGDVDRHFIQQRLREQKQREAEEREKQLKRRTPVHHHLYRPVSAKTTDNSNDNYEVDDELISLFLQPSSGIKDTNRTRVTNGTFERTRNVDRFVQPGLFEAGDLIPDREKAKRPSSAKVQQQADMARARPKSAVLPKNERPLKYETTRPVSAKVSSTTTTRAKSAKGPRPNIEPREVAQEKKKAHVYFPVDSSPSLAHKDTVSEDLKRVRQMEEEFKQTTRLLQQRLGIAEDGAI
ncbi:uncharacterized protein [Ptychodera flava]|uniref:uncharacterized protein isoform X1 n=1 Tax=Ptychodera flava TaxID=63121 RepID=UPI00396AA01D